MRVGRRWQGLAAAACVVVTGAPALTAGRAVTLASLDGTALAGQLYEASPRPASGVVLVPMLGRTRADWDEIAQQLEAGGITVLAVDIRGHGGSGGSTSALPEMTQDVRAAIRWLSARAGVRTEAIAVAGASLGANLALLAAADQPVRAVAAVSASLDYRGVRIGPELIRKLGSRPVWLAASTDDPFASRTIRELSAGSAGTLEQQLSPTAAHGTNLLAADRTLARALVDWLRQRLLS